MPSGGGHLANGLFPAVIVEAAVVCGGVGTDGFNVSHKILDGRVPTLRERGRGEGGPNNSGGAQQLEEGGDFVRMPSKI